jgi:hypothetical protein
MTGSLLSGYIFWPEWRGCDFGSAERERGMAGDSGLWEDASHAMKVDLGENGGKSLLGKYALEDRNRD